MFKGETTKKSTCILMIIVGQVHNCQPVFSVLSLPFHANMMMKLKQTELCSRLLFFYSINTGNDKLPLFY